MPIRPMPFEKELTKKELEKWNEIKHILSNQDLCCEQSSVVDSTTQETDDLNSWIDSLFSQNKTKSRIAEEHQAKLELSKVMEGFKEKTMTDIFIKVSRKIKDHRFGDNFVNEIEFGKALLKFLQDQEIKSKNNLEKISDYELLQEPNDQRLSNVNWFDISDSGELTPLYESGGREFAWKYNSQPKKCLKSIHLNHPKSCPDIIITTILPKPHQPNKGAVIESKIVLYWCTKVLREDGSFERSTMTTSEGLEEDWRGVYLSPSNIETLASCVKDKISKLCISVLKYERIVFY